MYQQGIFRGQWMSVSPQLLKFTIYLLGQLSWVFDPRPLSYLEHILSRHTCWRSWLLINNIYRVEPRSTDTRLIRTPGCYRQFRLSWRRAHMFSLKWTHLIRTPVNTDKGHFSVSRVTNSHTLSTPLYGHFLSVHYLFLTFLRVCLIFNST